MRSWRRCLQWGTRPCENSDARRARRNILEKLRVLRTDNAADIRLDAMSENCVFYISPMYEFSHSLGPSSATLIEGPEPCKCYPSLSRLTTLWI